MRVLTGTPIALSVVAASQSQVECSAAAGTEGCPSLGNSLLQHKGQTMQITATALVEQEDLEEERLVEQGNSSFIEMFDAEEDENRHCRWKGLGLVEDEDLDYANVMKLVDADGDSVEQLDGGYDSPTTVMKWDPDQRNCIYVADVNQQGTSYRFLKFKRDGQCEQMTVPAGNGVAIKTSSGKCWDVSAGVKKGIQEMDCEDGNPKQKFNVDPDSKVIRWAGDTNQCVYGRWNWVFIWWCHQEGGGMDARRERWYFTPAPEEAPPAAAAAAAAAPVTSAMKWDPDQSNCIYVDESKGGQLRFKRGGCEQMVVPAGDGVTIKTSSGKCWDVSKGVKKAIFAKDCEDHIDEQMFNVDPYTGIIRWAGDTHQCVYGRWNIVFIWWCHQEGGGLDARREKWHFEPAFEDTEPQSEPVPVPESGVGGGGGKAKYLGCYKDVGTRRNPNDLTHRMPYPGPERFTIASCLAACPDYKYIAMQWDRECYCDNSYAKVPCVTKVPDSECGGPCDGETADVDQKFCGKNMWRNAIYEVR